MRLTPELPVIPVRLSTNEERLLTSPVNILFFRYEVSGTGTGNIQRQTTSEKRGILLIFSTSRHLIGHLFGRRSMIHSKDDESEAKFAASTGIPGSLRYRYCTCKCLLAYLFCTDVPVAPDTSMMLTPVSYWADG